jgi:multidrug resistance efflux pump
MFYRLVTAFVLAAVNGIAQANCYVLYDQGGTRLYQGFDPPYSMAFPAVVPERDASKARGERLMIMPDINCDYAERYDEALRYVQSGDYARDKAANQANLESMQREMHAQDRADRMMEAAKAQQRMEGEQQAKIAAAQEQAERRRRASENAYRWQMLNKMDQIQRDVDSLR